MNAEELEWYEQRRIQENKHFLMHTIGEIPPRPAWEYRINLGAEDEQRFLDIRTVVAVIINIPYHSWPDDATWRSLLPPWFVAATPDIGRMEADALMESTPRNQWHTLPWDFGSWLAAIRIREWQWWSCQKSDTHMTIYLALFDWPAHLEAFEHIVRASKANIVYSDGLWAE